MTTYYVRIPANGGSDSNAGTSAGAAWATIGKALGASGIASGDTVYIGGGTYREVVTVAMTSATVETFVIGDVDGVKTGDVGEVRWTAYTTNDTTAPSGALCTLSGRDFLTFGRLTMIGGASAVISASTATSTNIKVQDCLLVGQPGDANGQAISMTIGFGVTANWIIERSFLHSSRANTVVIILTTGSGSDYDANIIIRNCTITGSSASCISVQSSGASAQEGGGVYIYNCSIMGGTSVGGGAVRTVGTSLTGSAFTFPIQVRNCVLRGSLTADEAGGAIVENYNHVMAVTTHTNVTVGANSITNDTYAWLLSNGQEVLTGSTPRSFYEPMTSSPYLGFGNDGTYTSSEDIRGNPRPAGGASATKGIGAYERSNTFAKETGTVRTGTNAISITGPGYQDFQLPVGITSTTVTVYVRWDATYAGTKPIMQVLNGTECGVSNATATATGSSGAWEQLSLNFTPTSSGIVTIRLLSSDTNGGGKMFADDFNVT